MKKECASKFGELSVIRNFEICKGCRFLFKETWGNDGYICADTPRGLGHPWCRESREPVSKDDFEKVHIHILDEKECLCK